MGATYRRWQDDPASPSAKSDRVLKVTVGKFGSPQELHGAASDGVSRRAVRSSPENAVSPQCISPLYIEMTP